MNTEFEKYTIVILLLVLVFAGCTKPNTAIKTKPVKSTVVTDSVGNMESIANALGCMFAPETCPKRKDTKETDR